MNVQVFNLAMLASWLLVLVGGVWLHPAVGLVGAGLLLIALTLVAVRLSGGLYGGSLRTTRRPPSDEDAS